MAEANEWKMRLRCQKCKVGNHWNRSATRIRPETTLAQNKEFMLCSACGSTNFDDPRPGRYVSSSVWWKPGTWSTGKWEWREDGVQVIETEDLPTPIELLARAHDK